MIELAKNLLLRDATKRLETAQAEIAALKRERDSLARELLTITLIKGKPKSPDEGWVEGFAFACNAISDEASRILTSLERGELR